MSKSSCTPRAEVPSENQEKLQGREGPTVVASASTEYKFSTWGKGVWLSHRAALRRMTGDRSSRWSTDFNVTVRE